MEVKAEAGVGPEEAPLVGLARLAATVEEAVERAHGMDTGQYKSLVVEEVVHRLTPIREEIQRLTADRGHLESLLSQGTLRAREVAAPIMMEVRRRVGLS